MRESPALTLIEMLEALGAVVSYHDPFIPRIKAVARARRADQSPLRAVDFHAYRRRRCGADRDRPRPDRLSDVARHAKLVVDTRNALPAPASPARR